MNVAIDLTLEAVACHGWQVVLLAKRSKKPIGEYWTITGDVDVIRRHVERVGNIGLVCGSASGVAVVDGDDVDVIRDMFSALGALAIWVETGSGKTHSYVKWEPNLSPKVKWEGRKVGEVQRGGTNGQPLLQHVVLPPSIHPDTGYPYRWHVDPRSPLPTLPAAWRDHLTATVVGPSSTHVANGTRADLKNAAPWDGPPPEELRSRAMQQPGSRRRSGGIKFQCPGCRAEGHDRHMDNAIVLLDGRWGCAINPEHRAAIAAALRVVPTGWYAALAAIAGVPTSWVRGW